MPGFEWGEIDVLRGVYVREGGEQSSETSAQDDQDPLPRASLAVETLESSQRAERLRHCARDGHEVRGGSERCQRSSGAEGAESGH